MKAVISDKIYIQTTPELAQELMDELTYKIPVKSGRGGKLNSFEVIRNYSIVKAGVLAIPQGRIDLIPEDYDVVDKRVLVHAEFPDPKLQLNSEQQPIWDAAETSCFLNAQPGWGKTFTALHIAMKLGQKTLVVCHNTMLRDQWVEEIKVMFGMTAGVIGSGRFEVEPTIVVANVQSMSKRLVQLSSMFGTIVMDEAHHCAASTFESIVASSKAMYRIALSGTMTRKDGKHIIFKDIFGPVIFKPNVSNVMMPLINIVNTGRRLLPGADWVHKINDLMQDEDYINFIATLAARKAMAGHKVLVIADRVDFLRRVHELLGKESLLVVGESTFEEREEAKDLIVTSDKHIICGSRSIFSEGISINCLSYLILATPYSSTILLQQVIGRVQRMYPAKLQPEVADLQFVGEYNQNNIRAGFYIEQGWEVNYV